jgi:hypothetical protein
VITHTGGKRLEEPGVVRPMLGLDGGAGRMRVWRGCLACPACRAPSFVGPKRCAPGVLRAAVLEVMRHVARHEDERPGVRPRHFGIDKEQAETPATSARRLQSGSLGS